MFHAHPNPNMWTEFRTGVLCFVKDNSLKSYYIRLIDISVSMKLYFYNYVITSQDIMKNCNIEIFVSLAFVFQSFSLLK